MYIRGANFLQKQEWYYGNLYMTHKDEKWQKSVLQWARVPSRTPLFLTWNAPLEVFNTQMQGDRQQVPGIIRRSNIDSVIVYISDRAVTSENSTIPSIGF